ncbi:MAG: DUF4493 domain-containing protein [Phocaeicola sp.]
MKRLQLISLTVLSMLIALTACHSEKVSFQMDTFGQLKLSSMQVTADTEPLVTASRVSADINDYLITVYAANGEKLQEWKYAEMPEIFTLKTGAYKLVAHAPEVTGAAFDTPYCASAEKSFEIRQDEITEIGEVKCTLHNVKVTVKYEDKLMALLGDGVKVTVKVGEEKLEYTKDETKSGFFHGKAENNVVDVVFQGSVEGEPVSITKSYAEIALGTELIVTYKYKESVTGIDPGTGGSFHAPGISVDEKLIAVNETGAVLPEEDEILDFGKPAIEGDGFDLSQPVTNLNQKVVVNLMAPDGIAHVKVEIASENETFAGVIQEMFGGPFDLAYPGTLEETLKGLKLPVSEQVINQQLVKFDVTEFMPLLKGEFAGIHRFIIEVVDNNNSSVKATLTVDSTNAK